MPFNFNGKTIVITGGSSGIGAAAATEFQKSGGRIINLDIQNPGEESSGSVQEKGMFIPCDVSDESQVEKAFLRIRDEFGELDVLVNNAGIQTHGSVTDTSLELWEKTMSINLKGSFLCSKYAIPLMMDRTHPVIVNVASVQSFVSQKDQVAYITSKTALLGLTRCIAVDYAPKLRCVAVCPGAVDTPMLRKEFERFQNSRAMIEETEQIHLLERISQPEEVANFILFLASEQASFATGQSYRVDGGIGLKIEGT
jgi:NAD(P)-dependent dehydrogenase (short-subunit alcohol dehydrogenase family)